MKKLSKIDESVWGDLRKRSSGEVTRREDDVNNLDIEGLCEYIKKHYKIIEVIGRNAITHGSSFINVSLFKWKGITRNIILDTIKHNIRIRTPYFKLWPKDIINTINEKYKIEDGLDINRDYMTYITPKEGEANNNFFIDFIDTIISVAKTPVLEKIS